MVYVMKANYKTEVVKTEKDGKTYLDLVCYFGEKSFILKPFTDSRKARTYFYRLLEEAVK